MEKIGFREHESQTQPKSAAFAERFGAFLVEKGHLNDLSLRRAQRAHVQSGERFDLVLTRLGLLSESELASAFSTYLGLPLMSSDELAHAVPFATELKREFLSGATIVPVRDEGGRVLLAMADPFNEEALAAVSFQLSRPVDRAVAARSDVMSAIKQNYAGENERDVPSRHGDDAATEAQASEEDVRHLEELASEAPIIRLVHDLIARAAEMGASDIHFEPRSDSLHARFRIDGILHTVEQLPPTVKAAVTSRIKIMARLNIAERRLPQDGRITATVQGRKIDLRVSTIPTIGGESVVLRLLDRSQVQLDFAKLGFDDERRAKFIETLRQPNGIILVTGPTGSGKTTTLYTALSLLNNTERKTFTVEDPVEYEVAGVNQIQVQPKIGLTFGNTLRSILRQDPDIVMVGEIRDLETAQVSIQASLTGHLVLSTVHTNSAAATVARLLDMGVENYLLASTLKGVLAQRLVRTLCQNCAAPTEPTPVLIDSLKSAGVAHDAANWAAHLRKPIGCNACRQTGFRGRTMVSELLVLNSHIQESILGDTTERRIEEVARASGMISMFEDGLGKVLGGETTLDEVIRVTRMG